MMDLNVIRFKKKELMRFICVLERGYIPVQKKITAPRINEVRRKIIFYKELEFDQD